MLRPREDIEHDLRSGDLHDVRMALDECLASVRDEDVPALARMDIAAVVPADLPASRIPADLADALLRFLLGWPRFEPALTARERGAEVTRFVFRAPPFAYTAVHHCRGATDRGATITGVVEALASATPNDLDVAECLLEYALEEDVDEPHALAAAAAWSGRPGFERMTAMVEHAKARRAAT